MTEAKFSDAKSVLAFMFAGNATFTFRSQRTGARFTYKIQKGEDAQPGNVRFSEAAPDRFFVKVLTGPDNTADYTYVGMVVNNTFRTTRASKMNIDSLPVKTFVWALGQFQKGTLPELMEVWHVGRCGRCGRVLTVPESIASGFGPDCIEMMGGMQAVLTLKAETQEQKDERLAMESHREKTFRGVDPATAPVRPANGWNSSGWLETASKRESVDQELARLVAEAVEEYKRTQPENYYQDGMLDEEEAHAVATNKFRKELEQDDRYLGSKFGEYEREQEEAAGRKL
jgi:hypothetical protein